MKSHGLLWIFTDPQAAHLESCWFLAAEWFRRMISSCTVKVSEANSRNGWSSC